MTVGRVCLPLLLLPLLLLPGPAQPYDLLHLAGAAQQDCVLYALRPALQLRVQVRRALVAALASNSEWFTPSGTGEAACRAEADTAVVQTGLPGQDTETAAPVSHVMSGELHHHCAGQPGDGLRKEEDAGLRRGVRALAVHSRQVSGVL